MPKSQNVRQRILPDQAVIIGFLSFLGYICGFAHEAGQLTFFAVPISFIQVNLNTIFIAICVVLIFAFLIFSFKKDFNDKSDKIFSGWFILFLFTLGGFFWYKSKDPFLIILGVFAVIFNLFPRAHSAAEKLDKLVLVIPYTFFAVALCFVLGLGTGVFNTLFGNISIFETEGQKYAIIKVYGNQIITKKVIDSTIKNQIQIFNYEFMTDKKIPIQARSGVVFDIEH